MTLVDSARADTVLAGRYRLVKLIGTGGMGSVYEARDEHTYRAVAVKLFATPVSCRSSTPAPTSSRTARSASS